MILTYSGLEIWFREKNVNEVSILPNAGMLQGLKIWGGGRIIRGGQKSRGASSKGGAKIWGGRTPPPPPAFPLPTCLRMDLTH